MKLGVEAAEKALAFDDSNASTYNGLCMLYIMQRQHEKAIGAGERLVELVPSGATANMSLGTTLSYAGRHEKAIVSHKKAISLNPFPPRIYFRNLGTAYRVTGRYEEAIAEYKKSLQENLDDLFTHLGVAIAHVSSGREEEARAESREVLRIHPRFSLDHFAQTLPYENPSELEHAIERLRKAGPK